MNLGRKSVTDQVTDKMKPDSQKSTTEKLGDNVSQKADHVGSALQPEYVNLQPHYDASDADNVPSSQKSSTQKASDSLRGTGDNAADKSKGLGQQISDTVSGAAQSVKDTVSGDKQNKDL